MGALVSSVAAAMAGDRHPAPPGPVTITSPGSGPRTHAESSVARSTRPPSGAAPGECFEDRPDAQSASRRPRTAKSYGSSYTGVADVSSHRPLETSSCVPSAATVSREPAGSGTGERRVVAQGVPVGQRRGKALAERPGLHHLQRHRRRGRASHGGDAGARPPGQRIVTSLRHSHRCDRPLAGPTATAVRPRRSGTYRLRSWTGACGRTVWFTIASRVRLWSTEPRTAGFTATTSADSSSRSPARRVRTPRPAPRARRDVARR